MAFKVSSRVYVTIYDTSVDQSFFSYYMKNGEPCMHECVELCLLFLLIQVKA